MSLSAPKGYYPTFEITENDDGIRPAGKPDECFYCQRAVGQMHQDGCVITWRNKKVKLIAHVEFEEEVPEHYTDEDIDFKFNESSWCASNIWDRFDERDCGCGATTVELMEEDTPRAA